jgi:hypothetical protein
MRDALLAMRQCLTRAVVDGNSQISSLRSMNGILKRQRSACVTSDYRNIGNCRARPRQALAQNYPVGSSVHSPFY